MYRGIEEVIVEVSAFNLGSPCLKRFYFCLRFGPRFPTLNPTHRTTHVEGLLGTPLGFQTTSGEGVGAQGSPRCFTPTL